MKNLIAISLIFISVLSFGQNLWNPVSGSLTRNVKYGEGIQVEDTLLAKGLLYFPSGASNGKVLTSNANGVATWQTAGAISGDTSLWKLGAGTNSVMDKRSISSTGDESTTIGTDATNSGDYSLVFGYNSSNSNNFSLVVGDDNTNSGLNGVIVGDGCNNSGTYGILIGSGGVNTFSKSIGLGADATPTAANQLMLSDSIAQVMFRRVTKLNAPLLPSDSTAVGTKDFWVDINGFIRRKF